MWAQIIQGVLGFLLGLWKEQSQTIGTDAVANPTMRKKLTTKLDAWKARTGAK